MKKIAIIENIHKDGLDIIDKDPDYEYELISDVSEENLIKKLPDYDACTLRVSKLNENIPVSYTHLTLPTICSV